MKLVTSYLVVRKDQIPCKRYCKLGHLNAVQKPPAAAALGMR